MESASQRGHQVLPALSDGSKHLADIGADTRTRIDDRGEQRIGRLRKLTPLLDSLDRVRKGGPNAPLNGVPKLNQRGIGRDTLLDPIRRVVANASPHFDHGFLKLEIVEAEKNFENMSSPSGDAAN